MGLSIPLEKRERLGRTIENGPLAVDDDSPGALFQRNLGIVQESDQFDKRNALSANNVSLPPLDNDVSQTAHDVDVEGRTFCGKRSNFELTIKTVQLRWCICNDYNSRNNLSQRNAAATETREWSTFSVRSLHPRASVQTSLPPGQYTLRVNISRRRVGMQFNLPKI